jgi:uncharacterized protein
MIRINVAQQLQQLVGVTRLYKVSETNKANGYKVEGELKLTRTDKGILITGELNTAQRFTCSRCLEVFEYPLTLSLAEEFVPTMDIVSGALLPVPDDLFTVDTNHEICLDDALSQYTLTSLPMIPLCRPDCKGLCDHCGLNLNNGDCTCSHDIDPRWVVLTGLTSTVKR